MPDPDAAALAEDVMEHVRALRKLLLGGGPEPHDAGAAGLTGPQVAAMAALVKDGPATVTQLADRLHLSHSTTSGIVDRLQARDLVTRTRDENDRRISRIAVTPQVQDYVRRIRSSPYGGLVAALERATPAQRAAVVDGLTTLRELLDPAAERAAG
ncbi:MarR family winged helix-turn-helix transcriptional regulator [Pseudonocardia sp. CA-107938]|uniref:MarR family winged helix-turn-helix transcriptional regulator n=1 Tax=Pseudonocardia sp. CA-107938 TaxID=3240021 RepID=UPI003D8FB91C